jgi:lipopolysaccharide exporter
MDQGLILDDSTGTITDQIEPKKDSQKAFAKDVALIVGGTTIAQVIGILTSPIITRLFGAEAFGLSALFASLVNTIVVISCLRYEFTIMLPKKDEEAINLLAVSLIINTTISFILIPTMWFLGQDIADILNAPNLAQYLWLVPLMVFLTGSFQAINYWNSRKRQFRRLSTAQVSKAASNAGSQILFGYAGLATGGSLIGASIIGQSFATFTLGIRVWWEDRKLMKGAVNRKVMKGLMREYRDFPIFDLWSGLINALSLQLPIIILSIYFTTAVVGHYSIGLLVLQLPISFIGQAIAKVFYQRAAAAYHVSLAALASITEQVIKRLFLIGVFPILVLTLIGQDLFIVVFGPEWGEAGLFSQILSIWILVIFISTPLSSILNVTKRMRLMLVFNIVLILVRSASLIWGGVLGDVYLALALFSLTGAIAWLVLFYWIMHKVGVSVLHMLRSVSKVIVLAAGLLLVIAGAVLAGLDSLLIVVLSLACMAVYYLAMVHYDPEMKGLATGITSRFRK